LLKGCGDIATTYSNTYVSDIGAVINKNT
jgi:hypothetical protein